MIAGIGSSGQLQGLYPQYNLNRVTAVKKVSASDKGDSVIEEEKKDESSLSVPEELKNAKEVSYSANPYDQMRKLADSTLLVGQNLNLVA